MAKKYYVVVKGKMPGIYLTWEDCRAQVEHFPGAVYKGFNAIAEAEEFLASHSTDVGNHPDNDKAGYEKGNYPKVSEEGNQNQAVSTGRHLIAYVDGSYDHSQRRYAYGCVLVFEQEVVTLNGSDNRQDYVSMRNVAGEILGSEQAISWAVEHGYEKITIYYDYEGIEKWAEGIWKANKAGTKEYQKFVEAKRQEIEIRFCKVAAHTGDTYNEMADKLAKEALGLT
ncbi:MAG: ribonuclease H family protein [Lachnospiraceae bacterium]|nr:ribonuclease H family protein [Lachnospiraceae bacterium]